MNSIILSLYGDMQTLNEIDNSLCWFKYNIISNVAHIYKHFLLDKVCINKLGNNSLQKFNDILLCLTEMSTCTDDKNYYKHIFDLILKMHENFLSKKIILSSSISIIYNEMKDFLDFIQYCKPIQLKQEYTYNKIFPVKYNGGSLKEFANNYIKDFYGSNEDLNVLSVQRCNENLLKYIITEDSYSDKFVNYLNIRNIKVNKEEVDVNV